MKTYQDLLQVKDTDKDRMAFVLALINDYKASEMYDTASISEQYFRHCNVTINNFKKMLYKVTGEAVEDIWSANYKMACRHYYRFITQECQFLLGNGVQWASANSTVTVRVEEGTSGAKEGYVVTATDGKGSPTDGYKYWYVEEKRDANAITTADKLGNKRCPFDNQLQKAGLYALWGTVSYGFYNVDHIDVFNSLEFAPLWDEETGALSAGVRFWRLDKTKPLRATLYEVDGYTEMMFYPDLKKFEPSKEWTIVDKGYAIKDKRAYVLNVIGDSKDIEDNTEIVEGTNYKTFPIVPLWGNQAHQNEIVGLREQIDCYDLIKSGFANTVDDASDFYWTFSGLSDLSDEEMQAVREKIHRLRAVNLPPDVNATTNTINVPYQSSQILLEKLDKDLYRDAMALDVDGIANGAINETQLKAAYEPLNSKCDSFEYCVLDFIYGILDLAGIDDEATFTRSMISNTTENIQTIIQAAPYLSSEYVTEKIMTYLGDGDRVEAMMQQIEEDNYARFTNEDEISD